MQFLKSVKNIGIVMAFFAVFIMGVLFQILNERFLKASDSQFLDIKQNLHVSTKVMADEFHAIPTFSASSLLSKKLKLTQEDKMAIDDVFKKVLERVSQESFCHGGSYEVRPAYQYVDGIRNIAGQQLHAQLMCKITQEQEQAYNTLLVDIDSLLQQNEYVALNIPALNMGLSPESVKESQKHLHAQILDESNRMAQEYSTQLKRNCIVKSVHFLGGNAPIALMAVSQDSTTRSKLPIITEKEVHLSADVYFKCAQI